MQLWCTSGVPLEQTVVMSLWKEKGLCRYVTQSRRTFQGTSQLPQTTAEPGSGLQWLSLHDSHSNTTSTRWIAAHQIAKEEDLSRPAQIKTKQRLWGSRFRGGMYDPRNMRPSNLNRGATRGYFISPISLLTRIHTLPEQSVLLS